MAPHNSAFANLPSRSRSGVAVSRISHPLIWLFLLAPQQNAYLWALQEPLLERGSHIEIVSHRLPSGIGVGWLATLTADPLTYVDTATVTAVALENIGQLRVNIGRDKAAMNAATLFGAILGAALAPVVSPGSRNCRLGLRGEDECGHEVPVEVVGALFGAGGVRMLTRTALDERWVNVRLDRLLYSVNAHDRP